MANQRIYTVTINGLTESVKAVDALNESLKTLEARIKALEGKSVSVGSKSSGGGSSKASSTSSLSEEEKLEQQIEKLDAKRVAYSKQIYQNYLAAKDVLAETEKDQKSIAASERLQANEYTNTIAGLKQELADIKTAMQTVDLGDTDQFGKMAQRAKELNDKLKEIEQSYGQFSRNVGNYRDSLNGITVTIAGVTREFSNSRNALRTLKQELDSLSASEKGNSNYAKELRREYNRLKSAIDDATKSSKFMDEALDTMQSFTALNQISQGFSTFFGVDNSEMERQIARLVALQNALQGLEKINKQIDSEEGIGKWLAKGSRGIDEFITKITGAEKRMGLFIGKTRQGSIAINAFAKVLKGVGAVALTGGVLALTSLFGETIDWLKRLTNSGIEAGKATDILNEQFDNLAATIERLQRENASAYFSGIASDAAYLKNNITYVNQELQNMISNLDGLEKISSNTTIKTSFGLFGGINKELATGNQEIKKAFKEQLELIHKHEKDIESANPLRRLFNSVIPEASQTKKNVQALGEAILNDFVVRVAEVSQKAADEMARTKKLSYETKEEIKNLNREANEDFSTSSVLNNVEIFSKNGKFFANQINGVKNALQGLNNAANETALDPDYLVQLRIDAMKDGAAKIKAQNELNRKREIEQANGNLEAIAAINQKFDHELQEQMKTVNQQYNAALNDLYNLRIQAMREGLAKELAQLNQEKREKLQAIIADGKLVGEREVALNKLYDKKILEAKRDWAFEMKKVYADLYSNIEAITRGTFETEVNTAQLNVENSMAEKKGNSWSSSSNTKSLEDREKYYKEILKIETKGGERIAAAQEEQLAKELEFNQKEEKLRHERLVNAKTTATVMAELANYEKKNGVPLVPDSADSEWKKLEETLQESLHNMRGELVDAYNEGKIDFKQFVGLIEDEEDAHTSRMNALEKQYAAESKKIVIDSNNEKKQAINNYFQDVISTIRTKQDEIADAMQKTPIIENDWGVVQISKTKRNYNEALKQYESLSTKVQEKKEELKEKLDNKEISPEDFFMRDSELDAIQKSINESIKEVKNKQKTMLADFIQSLQVYIQAAVNSFNDIMNAVWDAQDVQFDKEQEALDKENEMIQEKLDKQQEMIEEHKNAVDSIEDELANSRGDRRQHLIDQLNAEMEAERRAQKEKERLQKLEEVNKKKQEKLDEKRKKAEYNRQKLQAIVNGAMAVTYAAINTWPIPAIPMMALAASTTAAQLAIMAANKPYAKGGQLDGGVAVGNRHRDGGIKVLGGRAEIEGGEFITNRLTTEKNIDLLEFVNSKKKKIDVNDMLEFYSSGSVKKNIMKMSPKAKFADGGYIPPTLSNNIDLDDRLMSAFENYSNRPVVVSVVDITNKQEDVRRVQTLAGL